MKKTKERKTENIQSCEKDANGHCTINKEQPQPCRQEKEQIYCKGGVLSSDVSKVRKSGCPCMSSREYSELPK